MALHLVIPCYMNQSVIEKNIGETKAESLLSWQQYYQSVSLLLHPAALPPKTNLSGHSKEWKMAHIVIILTYCLEYEKKSVFQPLHRGLPSGNIGVQADFSVYSLYKILPFSPGIPSWPVQLPKAKCIFPFLDHP